MDQSNGIHIVTHCYAAQLPHYASLLRYQLASLVYHPPEVPVCIEVCYTDSDAETQQVVDYFVTHTHLNMIIHDLSPDRLFRRSIGRNLAALRSHADLVWFTDCDHVFGPRCLDELWSIWNGLESWHPMLWPGTIWIHQDHETGDDAAREPGALPKIRAEQFVPKRYSRAIGGVQIVPGSFARTYGYLDTNVKFQTPSSTPFGDFRDDVAYRAFCREHGELLKINVPNLYRMRHTQTSYQ